MRSTVVPGTTENLQKKYKKLKLVFNPEFLTERAAHFDFISQTRIVLGGGKRRMYQKLKNSIWIDLEIIYQFWRLIFSQQN